MDILPIELIALIVEYACFDDLGKTARQLGLVSKAFRVIAEPMELRAIAVSGLEHLQCVISKVERLRHVSRDRYKRKRMSAKYGTKHLFICELTKEHALAVDTESERSIVRNLSSVSPTLDTHKLEQDYRSQTFEFWLLADKLIRSFSGTLETLSLVAWENWLMSTSWASEREGDPESPQVLVTLCGASFPNLVSLTVVHNAASGTNCFGRGNYHFIHPFMPLLRSLHIVTPTSLGAYPSMPSSRVGHPLLKEMHRNKPSLTHLILCHDWFPAEELVMMALFGPDWPAVQNSGRLPGNLQSIILRYGFMPRPRDFTVYHQLAKNFVNIVRGHGIDGLEAELPEPRFPERGRRRYELLMSEWEDGALPYHNGNINGA
ncbi:hypothetical protein ACEPAH_101 [Sanghuangporus vaninii]